MDNVLITPGLSDRDIVLIQVNVKPEVLKQVNRNIHLYKKADWDQLKQSMGMSILNSNSLTLLPLQYKVCGISWYSGWISMDKPRNPLPDEET